MPKALLIIDYTNDFVADNGALTCGAPAQALDINIVKLADDFLLNGDFVYLPTDVHVANDPSRRTTSAIPGGENFTARSASGTPNIKTTPR